MMAIHPSARIGHVHLTVAESAWPRSANGTIAMSTRPLDLERLLATAD